MTENKATLFQVDAFTDRLFGGNPAAVVPLNHWLDDSILQSIAMENNLAETAFTVPSGNGFELRWFTPTSEVALCGHATIATAFVLKTHRDFEESTIEFYTRKSGTLTVEQNSDGTLSMSFPSIKVSPNSDAAKVAKAIKGKSFELYAGHYSEKEFDYMAVFDSPQDVADIIPLFHAFSDLDSRGLIVTAIGNEKDNCDFVSRYFAPNFGVNEDPVTGSAHCLLTPFWTEKTGKTELRAHQISSRGGVIDCQVKEDRTILTGQCVDYLRGEISFS